MAAVPAGNTSRPHPHPGLFLALEGPDGGGKTTQAARLATGCGPGARRRRLPRPRQHRRGRPAPRDRARPKLGPPALQAEMLLYMASRAQLVDEVIAPSLAAGRVVVSDRFLLSNIVYQGFAGGLPVDEIWRVGQAATGGLLPDLTLVLDVPPDGGARTGRPGRDRIEDRPDAYRQRVREGFLEPRPRRRLGPGCCRYFYPAPDRRHRRVGRSRHGLRAGSEARWSVSWHSVRGHDRIVDVAPREPAERAVPARLPVRRARGSRQADLRPNAGPGPALRAEPRGAARPVRATAPAASRSRRAPTPTCSRSPGPRTSTSCRSRSSATSAPTSA